MRDLKERVIFAAGLVFDPNKSPECGLSAIIDTSLGSLRHAPSVIIVRSRNNRAELKRFLSRCPGDLFVVRSITSHAARSKFLDVAAVATGSGLALRVSSVVA